MTRAHKGWALDSVILHNDVTRFLKDDINQPPQEGVYVTGLFLEGASWDRRGIRLIEPKPKVLFEPLPVIHIYAINSTGGKDARMYECPIYKKPVRTGPYVYSYRRPQDNPESWSLDSAWCGVTLRHQVEPSVGCFFGWGEHHMPYSVWQVECLLDPKTAIISTFIIALTS